MRTAVIAGVLVALGLLVVEAVLVPSFLFTHRRTLPMEMAAGQTLVGLTARLHGGNQPSPFAQDAVAAISGQNAYRNCVQCHGSAGDGKGALSKGLYPPPTDLSSDAAKRLNDGQIFWIVKNGLSYTAMPGFGSQMPDNEIWGLVSYIRDLQGKQALSFESATAPDAAPSATATAEPPNTQHLAIALSDSAAQPATVQANAGSVELDLRNTGTKPHQIAIAAIGKVPFSAGRLAPAQAFKLRSVLPPGDYTIALDAGTPNPGPAVRVSLR